MSLDLLPKLRFLLNANLFGSVELVQAAKVHVLGQERDDVFVKGLPVWVLQVVLLALFPEVSVSGKTKVDRRKWSGAYAFVFVAFDDGEGAGVLGILHDEPLWFVSPSILRQL